jgi:rhodanese-related sulfurtransferase
MNFQKLKYAFIIVLFLVILYGCSENTSEVPATVNESEVLVTYLEGDDGGYINNNSSAIITASEVMSNILTQQEQVVIDIRKEADYNLGHIKGAVNVTINDIVDYYKSNNLESKKLVVITCYSGQGAGFATTLLRLLGYSNVKDLLWGMCSWNSTTSSYWTSAINNSRAAQFKTTANPKASSGDLPTLNTSETSGENILLSRIQTLLSSSDPLGDVKVSSDAVYSNLNNYYIINYWSEEDYNWGHIDGAIQYTPKESLFLETDLTTLPTDKTIAVYCYTGHISAQVAGYLRTLGYDAKTIVFGVNGMAYDAMPGTKFVAKSDVHDFVLEK